MRPAVVFLGPTLSVTDAREVLPSAEYLPPARRGDVYHACRKRPWAIALIDGHFEQQLSVWHKEVLWALSHGIRVYGAASMGALRAAELAPFGMIGIGRIFALYRDGHLEDDDEVAVAHNSREHGYAHVSEAMVDIRETLREAERLGLATARTVARVVDLAKARFYPERSLLVVLEQARAEGCTGGEIDRLSSWVESLPRRIVDSKRDDALQLLTRLRDDAVMSSHAAPPPAFHFEHTEAWDQFLREQVAR